MRCQPAGDRPRHVQRTSGSTGSGSRGDGQDVRRTKKDRGQPAGQKNQSVPGTDPSAASRPASDRPSRLYDGHLVRRDPAECVVSRPAIGRATFGELPAPRVPAPAATDKMSVVQRKIAASRLARRTNPCQALIVLLPAGRPAIGRVTFGGLPAPRVPAPAATDKMSVVQRTEPIRRTNQCQPLIEPIRARH